MLETVRALRTGEDLRNDVVLLITDGEEDGVLGAEAFVQEHPLARAGGVVLNWEARGVSGPSLLFVTTPDNAALVDMFTATVPHPRGDSSMVELYRLLPNNTDFTPLTTTARFSGMNFAYIEESSHYHTAADTIANLHPGGRVRWRRDDGCAMTGAPRARRAWPAGRAQMGGRRTRGDGLHMRRRPMRDQAHDPHTTNAQAAGSRWCTDGSGHIGVGPRPPPPGTPHGCTA